MSDQFAIMLSIKHRVSCTSYLVKHAKSNSTLLAFIDGLRVQTKVNVLFVNLNSCDKFKRIHSSYLKSYD